MSAPQYQEIAVEQLTQSLKSRKANMSKGEYKTKSLKNKPDPGQPKLKKTGLDKSQTPTRKAYWPSKRTENHTQTTRIKFGL